MYYQQTGPITPAQVFEAGTVPAAATVFAVHTFEVTAAGLLHYTDGLLRATVPPEGWDDYAERWTAAAEAIAAHRLAVAAASATAEVQS